MDQRDAPVNTPLRGIVVCDLAEGVAGPYAARLLADLGAAVIKVEGPSGDLTRRLGPFPPEHAHQDTSGLFHWLNAGKDGLTIDPADPAAASQLRAQLDNSHLVVVSAGAALEDLLATTVAAMPAVERPLIARVAAVQPQWGSAARSDGSFHAAAVSAVSSLIGVPDREPLTPPCNIIDHVAGANLAAAALACLLSEEHSGTRPSHLDAVVADFFSTGAPDTIIVPPTVPNTRSGSHSPGAGGKWPIGMFPTADGAVVIAARSDADWKALQRLAGNPSWITAPPLDDPRRIAADPRLTEQAEELLAAVTRTMTTDELERACLDLELPVGRVMSVAELEASEQWKEFGLFSAPIQVGHRTMRIANAPYRLSRTPIPRELHPGPTLGQRVQTRAASGRRHDAPSGAPSSPTSGADGGQPERLLAGVKVIELSVAFAGPTVGAVLADLGADVTKIEHSSHMDNSRMRFRPIRNGKPVEGALHEVSVYFHHCNRGKFGVSIDLKAPEGRELIERLISGADVVVENLSPGAFQRAGISYEKLAERNPRLVWLSLAAIGKTGPLSRVRGYAPIMSALAGQLSVTGYPDDDRLVIGTAVADQIGASHGTLVLLAALREARRTGLGQFIDVSMTAAAIASLGEAIAESQLTDRVPRPRGNSHVHRAPHGHYRTGDGRWVALSIASDDDWRNFVSVVPSVADFAFDECWTEDGRRARATSIEEGLREWFGSRTRREAMAQLRATDVPVTPILDRTDPLEDWDLWGGAMKPSLVEHPVTGTEPAHAIPIRFDGRFPTVRRAAPTLGQHTVQVLTEYLALEPPDIARLLDAKVIEVYEHTLVTAAQG
jgi:crotonobetainyl-CoA:carnitine CoA-transferase CaiB-like acyl-CoA transferase